MSDLDSLLEMVEASAIASKRKHFVANVMETGTDAHKAIECGIRIGQKFRAEALQALAAILEEGCMNHEMDKD